MPCHVRRILRPERRVLLLWMKQAGYGGIKEDCTHPVSPRLLRSLRRSRRSWNRYCESSSGSSSAGHSAAMASKSSTATTPCYSASSSRESVSQKASLSDCSIFLSMFLSRIIIVSTWRACSSSSSTIGCPVS